MNIHFIDQAHEGFFTTHSELFPQDCYYLPFLYLVGLTADTRSHFAEIYNFDYGGINPDCLSEQWQTSATQKVLRLAFNLFNDWAEGEARHNSVSYIFYSKYAPYFVEAMRLRYPDYLTKGGHT